MSTDVVTSTVPKNGSQKHTYFNVILVAGGQSPRRK